MKLLNFNIGILGHVDSGKTTLAKVLSTMASTASFDKNPQSQARGITIDLGFSGFLTDVPEHLKDFGYENIQYTLVDCPGHASLIRAIIGGAQIIDAMILVIDITKGMQTQTAECLVIGEILCNHMLIVLNKLDAIAPEKRASTIEKMTKRIKITLQNSKFSSANIVAVAACPGGSENSTGEPIGISDLIETIKKFTYLPSRKSSGEFVFAVDHCFSIKGQGTVLTGTVLEGAINVNDNIEMPTLKLSKKVKSMQMFKKPVQKASQGDRVGICVTQFDPKLLERCIVGSPSLITISYGLLARVEKISYYKFAVESKAKFHISIGHETVMATVNFFGIDEEQSDKNFNFSCEYKHQTKLINLTKDVDEEFMPKSQYAVLEFERPIPVLPNALLIGSKLDMDIHTSTCRLAFKGTALHIYPDKDFRQHSLDNLKVFKNKTKEGVIDRMVNDNEVICKNILKKDANIQLFIGLRVLLSTGESGIINSSFGQSGKLKIQIPKGLNEDTKMKLNSSQKKKGKKETVDDSIEPKDIIKVFLNFKKYVYSNTNKMIQT